MSRNTHDLTDYHRGTRAATAVELVEEIDAYLRAGMSVQEALAWIHYRLDELESGGAERFGIDAVLKGPRSGTIIGQAAIKKNMAGGLTADAEFVYGFLAKAITKKPMPTKTFTANARVKALIFPILVRVIIERGWASSITADAWIGGLAYYFTADSVIFATRAGSFIADAIVHAVISGSLTADAAIAILTSFSFTEDAVIHATIAGGITGDAVLGVSGRGGVIAADATLLRSWGFSWAQDAILHKNMGGSATADATISSGEEGIVSTTLGWIGLGEGSLGDA